MYWSYLSLTKRKLFVHVWLYEVYDSLSSEELDERLSRQLLRLQSQTDRVMEVFVTSLVASSVFGWLW